MALALTTQWILAVAWAGDAPCTCWSLSRALLCPGDAGDADQRCTGAVPNTDTRMSLPGTFPGTSSLPACSSPQRLLRGVSLILEEVSKKPLAW